MQLPNETITQLQAQAKLSPKKEICGFISTDFTIHPITNVSTNPNLFIMDRREFFKVSNTIDILALYHSHSNNTTPSDTDLTYQKKLKYNFLIVSPNSNSYNWIPYEP